MKHAYAKMANKNKEESNTKSNKIEANIDTRFFHEAWELIRITCEDHPGPLIVLEFIFVISISALVLTLLPVPSSFTARATEADPRTVVIVTATLVPIMVLIILSELVYYHLHSKKDIDWMGFFRRRSLPLLFLTAQLYNLAGFYTMLVPSLMYSALVASPPECSTFPKLFGTAMGIISAVSISKAIMSLTAASCALSWRQSITEYIHGRYVRKRRYYHLQLLHHNAVGGDVDNPDQRITREADLWSSNLADLLQTVAISLFNIIWYTIQTWIITGWSGPLIIFAYFVISAVVTRFTASPIAPLFANVDASEGDFRTTHLHLLQTAEATALCSEGKTEGAALDQAFGTLLTLRWTLVWKQSILNVVIYFFEYTGSIMNYVAIAIAVCSGTYSDLPPNELTALISRGSGFAISMMYGFTQLVAAISTVAELAGHTRRLATLLHALQDVDDTINMWSEEETSDNFQGRKKRQQISISADSTNNEDNHPLYYNDANNNTLLLSCRSLCVSLPTSTNYSDNKPILLENINFDVMLGGSVLIRGKPGIGKSSILRTICNIWPMGDSNNINSSIIYSESSALQLQELLCIPPLYDVQNDHLLSYLVLPQAAPFRIGLRTTLVDQVAYPLILDPNNPKTQEAVSQALDAVGLLTSKILSKINGFNTMYTPTEWNTMFSPGQRQLLACARVFLHRPALVLLDEATSSMPVVDEERIYRRLRKEGIAYVSVGHRTSLEQFHSFVFDCDVGMD